MKMISPTDRVNQAKAIDKVYVMARNSVTEPFTAAMMGRLYACHVPVVWGRANLVGVAPNPPRWTNAQYEWNCAINITHELGHILGLAHRGCAGYKPIPNPLPVTMPSADGMDCPDANGYIKGHPWWENIMSYGYSFTTPLAHNIDLIQASVVRAHPAIAY